MHTCIKPLQHAKHFTYHAGHAKAEDTKRSGLSDKPKSVSKPSEKPSGSAKARGNESARPDSKRPERIAAADQDANKSRTGDRGHLVARDSRKSEDKLAGGRSGQKRTRSRSGRCSCRLSAHLQMLC